MYPLSFKMTAGCGFLLIWVIMLHSQFPFSTGCLQDERSYLLDFKAGLSLSSGRLSSWRGFNCCEWEGVACDYHTSHVIRLDLSSNPVDYYLSDLSDYHKQQLTGEVRTSLCNLQHLQYLDLSWNDFNGTSIPPQLLKLHRLELLSLKNAGFGGEVPLELGNMSSLRHLDISGNDYLKCCKFDVWVRNLRSLEFLDMSWVNLSMASEHWGDALSGLPNLTQIHLFDCGLSGNIPDLSNLTRLSHLHIAYNSFPVQLPSWFENVSSLVSVDLSSCGVNGFIPSNFMPRSRMSNLVLDSNYGLKGNLSFMLSHSSSLVVLSLSQCNLTGVFPTSIANFSKLMRMDLGYNNLEGSIPSSFGSLTSLRYLYLNYNQLSGQIPPSLCQLPTLSELYLGHNQLSGAIPDCLSKLSSLDTLSLHSSGLRGNISLQLFENLTRLSQLVLSENQFFIDISTSWVPQFAHLEILELRSCSIEGNFPAFLSQQYQLSWLDLSDNNIVGNLPSWLWDLPNLYLLNLSNNQLEGSLPRKISHSFLTVDLHGNRLYGSLPALDFAANGLDLSNNGFNGSIPTTIGKCDTLLLSGNNLTGEIPSSICNNSGYHRVLDLSKNKLTGMIPSNIGRCSEMEILKLAQNVLQGKIPKELGNLQSLRTLNLNGNRLQGIIPPSIANCTDLQIFDLGNNNFEGSIPVWIEKLTDLRILSLASNKFDGRIPPQLFGLQYLQILDLPDNQLSGNIPSDVSKLCALVNNSQSFHLQYSSYYLEVTNWDTETQSLGFGRQHNYKELNNTTTESVDAVVMDRWWAMGVGLSYGVGFATVIAVLCFHMKWRYICFSFMDNFIYDLCE
ncbi:hypothetical protein SUGI_0865660 [Cryptomeria japonica]|nr:hypothetical protein SUGI_0865660 [Cryptomeria japonica]